MAGRGETIPKTPNQIYREVYISFLPVSRPVHGDKSQRTRLWLIHVQERALRRTTRALDPAILDPQGDPSPVDLECAEREGAKERLRF